MEKNKEKRSRKNSGSSSVAVGIISFFLGFLFAFIVLIGSIFGVGYYAVTMPINDVLGLFGLQNENESYNQEDPDSDKYNYINADTAPNVLALIQEIVKMANSGLGEISIDKIDALAPVTDSILDIAYEYIDEVVDFDKEAFRNVSLVSILDTITNSVYYVRTSKLFNLINDKIDNALDDILNISIASYLINGVEAEYATVVGADASFKLPVLFDYYVLDSEEIGYNRTLPVNGTSSYPENMTVGAGVSLEEKYPYITETMSKNADGKTLYRVYYVPCKVSGTSVTEAEYTLNLLYQRNESVSYTDKNGETQYLNYTFRTIEYGADTVFVAVKPQMVDGKETFVLDPATIDDSCMYYAPYARNYHSGVKVRSESDALYGVSTINGINYFKDNAGNVIDYDPLTVSDLMLDPAEPLSNIYLSDLLTDFVGEGNTDMINEVLAGISLGDVLKGNVDFDEVIEDIRISTFLNEVKADDTIMTFIVYNISNVENDGHGNYTAIYDKGGENEKTVTLEVDASGVIKSMKDGSGNAVYGNTVKDLNTITDGLTLDIFLDVKADDAIMAYLGYGITDVVEVSEKAWQYEGKDTNDNTVRIYTDSDGYITKVTDTEGNTVNGTTIDDVSDRIDGIMDVIAIPDIIDVKADDPIMAYLGYGVTDVVEVSDKDWQYEGKDTSDNTVRIYTDGDGYITKVTDTDGKSIGGTSINDISSRVENIMDVLTLSDVIDVKVTDPIMAYIGFGLTDVEEVMGQAYGYTGICDGVTVYIYVDGEDYVTKVTDTDGNSIGGTAISDVNTRVENIMDVLTLPDFIDIDPDNVIMAYIGYGVYDVTAQNGTDANTGKDYSYVGVYKQGVNEVNVYISTKTDGTDTYVKSVWLADDGTKVKGTKINDVADRLDGITDAIAISEFIDIDATDAIMAYLGYGVYDVVAIDGEDWQFEATYGEGLDAITVRIYADDSNIITKVTDTTASQNVINGTKIGEVADRLDGITDAIAISEFIDIDATDAIMAYLGYGVYDVVAIDGEDWQFEATYGEGLDAITVHIYADGSNIITKVTDTTASQNVIGGTKIGKVADRLDGITDAIAVTEFMDIDPNDAIMAYMGYGISKVTAEDGTDSLGNSYSYKGEYNSQECYITVDGDGNIDSVWYIDGGVKKVISGTKICNVPDRIGSLQSTLTIGEIIEVDGDSSKILQALENTPINGLDDKIKSLTVEDVLTEEQINSNSIIRQIRDKNILDISEEIDKVLIQRIYAANVYGVAEDADPTLAETYESEYLYYERTGNEEDGYKYEITTVGCYDEYGELLTGNAYDNAVGKLTAEQFAAGTYYTYGEAKGMWKLVLYRIDTDGTKTEKAYTLNNFNAMVDSCSDVVYNSTLNDLKTAGIIGDTVNLDKTIKTVDTGTPVDTSDPLNPTINYQYVTIVDGNIALTDNSGDAKTMGELSLKQLLTAITMYL